MGGSTSKEEKEVIIAQAGNSGGTSGAVNQVSFSLPEIGLFLFIIMVLAIIIYFVWRRCTKNVNKKISREIAKSRELITMALQNGKQ